MSFCVYKVNTFLYEKHFEAYKSLQAALLLCMDFVVRHKRFALQRC